MSLLKHENWFVCFIIMAFTGGLFTFVLAYSLNLYDKNAWYSKWQYWLLGAVCLIFPALIMLLVFLIEMMIKVAIKLNVPGKEIYASPYAWILCIIVPVLGWILLLVMFIYLLFWIIVMLYNKEGEKYYKK